MSVVKMSEDAVLPCRTEEPHQPGQLVFRRAYEHVCSILGLWSVEIVNVFPLTEFQEIETDE